MLDVALKFKAAFVLLAMRDKNFHEVVKVNNKGVSYSDWNDARSGLPFLKIFYDSTIHIFGSSYVTGHMYMKEVFGLRKKIHHYCESSDESIKKMASTMKENFIKYWENPDDINILLLIDCSSS